MANGGKTPPILSVTSRHKDTFTANRGYFARHGLGRMALGHRHAPGRPIRSRITPLVSDAG